MEYTPEEQTALQRAAEAKDAAKKRQRGIDREAKRMQAIENERRARVRQGERVAEMQQEKEERERRATEFRLSWETMLQPNLAELDAKIATARRELKALETQRYQFLSSFRDKCVHEYVYFGEKRYTSCWRDMECKYCRVQRPCDCSSCEGPHN